MPESIKFSDADIIAHILHRCAADKNEKFDPIELIKEKVGDEEISVETFERIKETLIQDKLLIVYSAYCVCASMKTIEIETIGGYGKYIANKLAEENRRKKLERRKDYAVKVSIVSSIVATIASFTSILISILQQLKQ